MAAPSQSSENQPPGGLHSPPSPVIGRWRIAVIAAAALLLGLGALAVIQVLFHPLLLLLAAIVIGEALSPIVSWLDRWLPRAIAIAIVYVALLAILALIGWLVLPILIEQVRSLAGSVPDLIRAVRQWLDRFGVSSAQLEQAATSLLNQASGLLTTLPFTIFNSAFQVAAVVFMSVYWLLEAPALKRFALSLFPEHRREEAGSVLGEMGHSIGGYIRGVVLDALVVGILAYIGVLIIGVKFPLVVGLLTMLGELVPVLGPFLAAVPAVAIGLLQSPTQALIVLGFYVALEQVEGHLVTPNIMRTQTNVPQLLILFALFAGAAIGGVLGVFVSIPLAGAVRVLVVRVVAPAVRHWAGVSAPDADAHEGT